MPFQLTKELKLPEINAILREWKHDCGAEVMHIETDDPENVFAIALRTWPSTSNGVAHVLEHTVLCGSKKYPVKDPFFAMQRRSLNTFLNAFTGSDFTCYPAASQNEKDFYNLFDVYLDAVFSPLLEKTRFQQEGIRLEFEKDKLTYKGIVFNEMKGALNSSHARMGESMLRELFAETIYGINSGGDPKHISKLTHDDLKAFHKEYYVPSRAVYYFYGNFPYQKHLDFLEERLLKDEEKTPPLPYPKRVERFKTPKKIEDFYPAHASENNPTLVSIGWITCPIENQLDSLALACLALILMDTDASLLKKVILKKGLAKSASLYFDNELPDHYFMLELVDCNEPEKVEEEILKALNVISEKGISKDRIDQTIHQLELSRLEMGGGSFPYGLNLFFASALLKLQGQAAEEGLKVHSLFDELNKTLKENPNYFSYLIDHYLLNNTHRVTIIMKPDFELEAKEQAEEDARLEKLNASLTPADIELINKEAKALKKAQKELGPKDCLPTVSLEDVPQTVKSFPLEMRNFNHLKVAEHEVFTNGLVYADLIYDLPAIPLSDIHYLRLLMAIITQVGAGGKSYEDTLNEIQSSTGGIYISLGMNPQATHPDLIRPSIHIKGKSLNTKAKTLFSLIKDFATKPGLNEKDRIAEVISKQRSQLESAFNANAMRYAKSLSSASLRTGCQLYDWCFGMSYTDFLTNLKEIPFEKFEQLFEHIFHYRSPELVIGGERSILRQLEKERYFGLIDLKDNGRAIPDWNIPLKTQPSQGRVISSSVAFISHSFKTVPYVHPDTPILALASNLMDSLFLHPLIREEGGAYGGGSSSIGNEGYFQLSSYRDPHVKSTLDAFKFAIHELAKGEFTDSDLTEAKFEFIQTLDQPVRPANRAEIAYMWLREGRTDQIRETNRKRALKATRTDIIEAVQKHLIPGFDEGVTVAIGSKKLLNQLPDLEIITPPPKQTS